MNPHKFLYKSREVHYFITLQSLFLGLSARRLTMWKEVIKLISLNDKSVHCSFKWWCGEGCGEREREWGREGRCRISRGLLPALCVGEVRGMDCKEEDRMYACLMGDFMEDLSIAQCFFTMAGNKGTKAWPLTSKQLNGWGEVSKDEDIRSLEYF